MDLKAVRQILGPLRERPVALSLCAFAVALLTSAVMALVAGPSAVWHVAERIQPAWLVVIVAGRLMSYGGYALAYRATFELRRGPELAPKQALALVAVGFGAFAAGGGFVVDRRALHGLGATPGGATSRVLGLGALEYAMLAPAAWVCALLLLGAGHVQASLTLPWLVCVPLGFAAATGLAWRRHSRGEDEPGQDGRGAGEEDGGRVRRSVGHALQGLAMLRELVLQGRREPAPWLGIFAYWAGELLSVWAGLRLFGIRLSPSRVVLAYATGYAISPRALPLAGVGLTEILMPLAYTWVGLGLAPAVVAVFAYRAVTLLVSLPPAMLARPLVKGISSESSANEATG